MKTNMKSLAGLMAGVALLFGACSDESSPDPIPADALVGNYVGKLAIGDQVNNSVAVTVSRVDSVVKIDAGKHIFDLLGVQLDIVFTTKDLVEVDGNVKFGPLSGIVKGTVFNVPEQVTEIGMLGKLTMNGTSYCSVNEVSYHGVGGTTTVSGHTGKTLSVSLTGVIEIDGREPIEEPITMELSRR